MTLPIGGAETPPLVSFHDALLSVMLGFHQIAAGLREGATGFADLLLQDPAALIAGAVLGVLGLILLLMVAKAITHVARHVRSTHVAAAPKPKPDEKDDLKSLPISEVEKRLESSPDGLSQAEAHTRQAKYGANEIAEAKSNALLKFLTYFWGPIPWMIEAAVILSAIARHWPDFAIISILLLANATVGFWEERQAGNAVAALKAKLAIKARVKRGGKWVTPAARDLVPGDVIRVRLGDIVPADARLLDGDPVEVDQSALTGESLPATRNPGDAVFSGSIVRRGEIDALVYATGTHTYFGKTAELVATANTVSHFQEAGTEDRKLPHHPGGGPGGDHHRLWHLPW